MQNELFYCWLGHKAVYYYPATVEWTFNCTSISRKQPQLKLFISIGKLANWCLRRAILFYYLAYSDPFCINFFCWWFLLFIRRQHHKKLLRNQMAYSKRLPKNKQHNGSALRTHIQYSNTEILRGGEKMSPLWYFQDNSTITGFAILLLYLPSLEQFIVIIQSVPWKACTVSGGNGGRSLGVWNECGSRIILWYATSPTTHPSTIISQFYI